MRLAFLLAMAVAIGSAQQFVDRVVASVNGHPILWSDVEEELRIDALLDGRPAAEITQNQRNAALTRLVDDELLSQQVTSANADQDVDAQQQEIDREIGDIRTERNATNPIDWERVLSRYGVTEHDVRARLLRQAQVLRFLDMRFRPGTQVSETEIERFYHDAFVPEMKKRGAAVPALENVRASIEKILVEQKVNAALEQYLQVLRGGARIWRSAPFAAADPASEGKH